MTKLNIVYASEMGAALDVADKTEAIAKDKGIDVAQFGMDSVSMEDLKSMNIDTRPVFPSISQYPIWGERHDENINSKIT